MTSEALLNETRLLFRALKEWGEALALHRGLSVTAPMRGALELILARGPSTVPDMARARGVSRQHIQQQVDGLLARGLVTRRDNPAHKRSSLIALTDKGRAMVQSMRAEERAALSRLQVGVSDEAVVEAAHVLAAWRAALRREVEGKEARGGPRFDESPPLEGSTGPS